MMRALIVAMAILLGASSPSISGQVLSVDAVNEIIDRHDLRHENPQDVSGEVCPGIEEQDLMALDDTYGIEVRVYERDGIIAKAGDVSITYTRNDFLSLSSITFFMLWQPATGLCTASLALTVL